MIRNDKQYQVTKSRLANFKDALAQLEALDIDPLDRELHEGAIRSQVEDFEEEIGQYELLKQGKLRYSTHSFFADWYQVLIKARIARGWTQADLAGKLGLKEQAIQRYEITDYSGANLSRIGEVTSALDIKLPEIKIKIEEIRIPEGVDPEEFHNAFRKMQDKRMLIP